MQKFCHTRGEFATFFAQIRCTVALELNEEIVQEAGDKTATLRYVPLGVTYALVPWNYLMVLAMGKIAPATEYICW